MKEVLLGIDLGGTNIKVSVFDRTFEKTHNRFNLNRKLLAD